MSISAAVAELNKEIVRLDKTVTEAQRTKARLISHRDALLKEDRAGGNGAVAKGKPGRKPGLAVKKTAGANRVAGAKKVSAPKKRTLSPEARKKIAEAQKKRWAAQKASSKAK